MTGFIRGLFNRNKSNDGEPAASSKKVEKSFFLEPDDAKTFGDIDYMRTPKTIKRTFPKTLSNQSEAARIEQVSAMQSIREGKTPQGSVPDYMAKTPSSTTPKPTPESPKFEPTVTNQRRTTDTNLDMFRDMARDMKRP